MSNRGYTLIELSVVVLLIGILMTISVPRVRETLLDDDLKVSARRLIGTARELRSASVRERTDAILHIDLGRTALWNYTADTTDEKRAELRRQAAPLPEGIRIAEIRQADGTRKTEGEALIRFYRGGYQTPAVIRLAKGDRTLSLVFHPFLRTPNVYESDVDFPFSQTKRDTGP